MRQTFWVVMLAAVVGLGAGCSSQGEPSYLLGAKGVAGYRVWPGASTVIPAGAVGFSVTASGAGGYRVAWTSTVGSADSFSGTIKTDGAFDPNMTTKLSGHESITAVGTNEVDFSSTPGTDVDGVDVLSTTDPVYLTALIGGSAVGVQIFFTGAITGDVSTSRYNPVAFTSP